MDEGQELGKGGNELIQRHKALKQRQQDEVICQCCCNTHNDACEDAGNQRGFLRFMAFIDETRSDHIGCAHQEVGDLANASGGGGQKLQGVFDKFNQQTGERSKGKCADECRKVR